MIDLLIWAVLVYMAASHGGAWVAALVAWACIASFMAMVMSE